MLDRRHVYVFNGLAKSDIVTQQQGSAMAGVEYRLPGLAPRLHPLPYVFQALIKGLPIVPFAPGHAQPQAALGPDHILNNQPLKAYGKIETRTGPMPIIRDVYVTVQKIYAPYQRQSRVYSVKH